MTLGLSLPFAITRDQKLHDDAIALAYPAFADVPYESAFQNPRLPRLRWARIANALDGLRMAALARPRGSVLDGIRQALAQSDLRRGPSDVYRHHADFVAALDANTAQRLIALEARLARDAPKGPQVISDVFPGT